MDATASSSVDTEEDWSALDEWLGQSRASGDELVERPGAQRRRWAITTKGHVHANFFHQGSKNSWEDIGASERVTENLKRLGFERPSSSQAASYEAQLEGRNVLLAYAQGTGKTLAYVAPVVQRLFELEAEEGRVGKGEVRAIILVPTSELAQQVLELARDVGRGKIKATIATGEHNWQSQRKKLRGGVDLLVTTMGRLIAHMMPREREPSATLGALRMLVVDEASSLYQGRLPSYLERQKREEEAESLRASGEQPQVGRNANANHKFIQGPTRAMWQILRSQLPETGCATTLVTGALQDGVEEEMLEEFPDLRVVKSRALHTTRSGIEATLVDCSRGVWKEGERRDSIFEGKLAELRAALEDSRHALVLCNTDRSIERIEREICNGPAWNAGNGKITHMICSGDVCSNRDVFPFHSSLTAEARSNALQNFRRPSERTSSSIPRVLIATGRAVRGLDLSAGPNRPVDLVVLFDFAPDAKAYLARVGCATRGDAPPARVTALAVRSQLSFARALIAHDETGQPHELLSDEESLYAS